MELPCPTGPGARPRSPSMRFELLIFDGFQLATLHHHFLQQNNLKLRWRQLISLFRRNRLPKIQHHRGQQQLQFVAHLQAVHVQLRTCDHKQLALLCVRQLVEPRYSNSSSHGGFVPQTCDDDAVAAQSKLCVHTSVASDSYPTFSNRSNPLEYCITSSLLGETVARAEHSKVMVEYGAGSKMEEPAQAHQQLMQMVSTMQQQENPHPWACAWAEAEHAAQLPPRPVQPAAQPAAVPFKPAPARPPMQPSSSSSMSGAPLNPAFPAQMGADPWFQARQQNQQ